MAKLSEVRYSPTAREGRTLLVHVTTPWLSQTVTVGVMCLLINCHKVILDVIHCSFKVQSLLLYDIDIEKSSHQHQRNQL